MTSRAAAINPRASRNRHGDSRIDAVAAVGLAE